MMVKNMKGEYTMATGQNEYLWHKACLAAMANNQLTQEWEVRLYTTSLYNAMLWGRGTN